MKVKEVVAGLDLRVFKYSIIFLLISCTTVNNEIKPYNKTINITKKNTNDILKKIDHDEIAELNSIDIVYSGSISTISRIDNDLWVGTLGGSLLRYNPYTDDIKIFTRDIYSIKDYSIKKVVDGNNFIYALQSDRVIIIDKSTQKVTYKTFPSEINRASDLILYNNRVYISTLGYGLREYLPQNNTFKEFIPNLQYISSLYLDGNNLLIGSMNNGLYIYDFQNRRLLSRIEYPIELLKNNFVQISKLNETFILGSSTNGLYKWNRELNTIDNLYENESVSFIDISKKGILAVSFIGSGIYLENKGAQRFESIKTSLLTNNITAVNIIDNYVITGNIKKGLIKQEIKFLDD